MCCCLLFQSSCFSSRVLSVSSILMLSFFCAIWRTEVHGKLGFDGCPILQLLFEYIVFSGSHNSVR